MYKYCFVDPGCADLVPNEDGAQLNSVTIIAVSVTIAVVIIIAICVAAFCVYRRYELPMLIMNYPGIELQ